MVKEKNEGVTGILSEVENFKYMQPGSQNSKINVLRRDYDYIHEYVFGDALVILLQFK